MIFKNKKIKEIHLNKDIDKEIEFQKTFKLDKNHIII